MLAIFRRHTLKCRYKSRKKRNCSCPIHVEGTLRGKTIRKSLETKNWDTAQSIVREWESAGKSDIAVQFSIAKEKFIQELAGRNLHWTTFNKYKLVMRQLEEFAAEKDLKLLQHFDLPTLRDFTATWKDGPLSKSKKIERLRTFLAFCQGSGWIDSNPSLHLKRPIVHEKPTLPFSRDEMKLMKENASGILLTFILVLRYSGLRISDAAMLKSSALNGDKLFLHMAKTGEPVFVPLPEELVVLLNQTGTKDGYYFAGGSRRMETVANNWRKRLATLWKRIEIQGGHPHRFRDTFAVELLLGGVDIKTVSMLLGHASVKVTEKHYAPWVRERQLKLEQEVRKSWEPEGIIPTTLVRGMPIDRNSSPTPDHEKKSSTIH
jgi:integrase/recombinase XerD